MMVRRRYSEVEAESRITLSAIAQAEMLYGLERRPQALKLRNTSEQFFDNLEILPWTAEAARVYAKVRSGLNSRGKSLSPIDMLIASHALAVGAILVSHDRAFQQLAPWLTVVDWATDL